MGFPQFFGSDSIADAWDAALHPDEPGYCEAVTELARRQEMLPSGVFVRIPHGEWRHERWATLVQNTVRLCKCEHRRLVQPKRTRDGTFDFGGEVVELLPGKPLDIAPWGGDRQSTCVRLQLLEPEEFIVIKWPFIPASVMRRSFDLTRATFTLNRKARDEATSRLTFDQLVLKMARHDKGRAVMQAYGVANLIVAPLCVVVGVGPGTALKLRIDPATAMFEADAPFTPHRCS